MNFKGFLKLFDDCGNEKIFILDIAGIHLACKMSNSDSLSNITETLIQTNSEQNLQLRDTAVQQQQAIGNSQSAINNQPPNLQSEIYNAEKSGQVLKSNIHIIPNPSASGVFTALCLQPTGHYSITIYNVLREIIYQSPTIHTHPNSDLTALSDEVRHSAEPALIPIDISTHPRGIYFVKITSGEEINVQKMVYQ